MIINDSQFQCVAAGVGGVLVPESVSILECCQDSDNLNIIYLTCSVSGIYRYEPHVTVLWDGNSVDVTNLLIPLYKGIGINNGTLDVGCGAGSFLLAYNVSSVIANFASIPEIQVQLQLVAVGLDLVIDPELTGLNLFASANPIAITTLTKGLTPQPYRLYFDSLTNELKVQYSSMGNTACLCAINCVSPDVSDFNLTTCTDEVQEVTIDSSSIFGDPTNANIIFQDSIGNTTNVSIQALINTKPAAPSILVQSDPDYINVNIFMVTINGTSIDSSKLKYQILRYENNPDNLIIWKDWTSKSWKSLYDRNIVAGRTYGYAVRFQGEFGEISLLSDWTTVTI